MKYILVLQLPEDTFTYDELIEQENIFISGLKGFATIDGHDVGVGEINYFVHTDNVKVAFEKIQPLLKDKAKSVLKAAYRTIKGEKYHIIYPPNLTSFCIS